MEEITGFDIDDIELYCRKLREGRISDKDFRTNVVLALGYNEEVLNHEQELHEVKGLW